MKNLVIVLLALTSTSAFASSAKPAPAAAARPAPSAGSSLSAPGAYGMAGCGLGSLVFKENTKMQILAATTNGTFGSQTFGITFGTSNCTPESRLVSKEQVQSYIAANQNALQNDVARGNGETLDGLADLMGQKNSTTFKSQLKNNYGSIFVANSSAQQITTNLFQVLN